MRFTRHLVTTLLALSVAALALAAPAKAARKPSGKEPSSTNPVLRGGPIDSSRASLPKFFLGNPVELIYAMFVGGPPRDEFETSAEYERRREKFATEGVYAFMLANVSAVYDADMERFTVEIPQKRVHSDPSIAVSAFEAASVIPAGDAAWLKQSSATAGKAVLSTYNLVVNGPRLHAENLLVEMPRDKARESKPYLRVLLLLRLQKDATFFVLDQDVDDIRAGPNVYTLRPASSTGEEGSYEPALIGDLDSVLVYDFRTGAIVARFTENDLRPKAETEIVPSVVEPDRPVQAVFADAEYPDVAQRAKIGGIVIAEITVDPDGSVVSVEILKPLPFGMDAAVTGAIRKSRFAPAIRGGVPVRSTLQVTYNFKVGLAHGTPLR